MSQVCMDTKIGVPYLLWHRHRRIVPHASRTRWYSTREERTDMVMVSLLEAAEEPLQPLVNPMVCSRGGKCLKRVSDPLGTLSPSWTDANRTVDKIDLGHDTILFFLQAAIFIEIMTELVERPSYDAHTLWLYCLVSIHILLKSMSRSRICARVIRTFRTKKGHTFKDRPMGMWKGEPSFQIWFTGICSPSAVQPSAVSN